MTKEQIQSLKDFIEEQEPTMEAYSIVIANSKQEASVHNDAQFGQLCLILKVLDAMIISVEYNNEKYVGLILRD